MRHLLSGLVVLCALSLGASGHPLIQNAMWLVFTPQEVKVAVNVSVREILVAQHVTAASDGSFDGDVLANASARHGKYLLDHFSIRWADASLRGRVVQITPPVLLGDTENTFYQYEFSFSWPAAGQPLAQVRLSHRVLADMPYAPGQKWEVTYAIRSKRSDREDVTTSLLAVDQPVTLPTGWEEGTQPVGASLTGERSLFSSYLVQGIHHILSGWDHLLFVAALILSTLRFWEMFKVVAVFTIAHSVTLAGSVLLGWSAPSRWVEPAVAVSIIVAGAGNLALPERFQGRARLGIAFAFGLVHGLGFAGALKVALAGLGSGAIVTALSAFSIGVEIGHQAVVLPGFALLRVVHQNAPIRYRTQAVHFGSALIACAGIGYLGRAVRWW